MFCKPLSIGTNKGEWTDIEKSEVVEDENMTCFVASMEIGSRLWPQPEGLPQAFELNPPELHSDFEGRTLVCTHKARVSWRWYTMYDVELADIFLSEDLRPGKLLYKPPTKLTRGTDACDMRPVRFETKTEGKCTGSGLSHHSDNCEQQPKRLTGNEILKPRMKMPGTRESPMQHLKLIIKSTSKGRKTARKATRGPTALADATMSYCAIEEASSPLRNAA